MANKIALDFFGEVVEQENAPVLHITEVEQGNKLFATLDKQMSPVSFIVDIAGSFARTLL